MAGQQKKLTVIISQQQGKHPAKRQLEEELAMTLMMDSEVEVSIVHIFNDMLLCCCFIILKINLFFVVFLLIIAVDVVLLV